jgi:plasmid stability protein
MTDLNVLERFASQNPISNSDAEKSLAPQQWRSMLENIVSNELPHERAVVPPRRRKGIRLVTLGAAALAVAIVAPTLWADGPTGASPAAAKVLHAGADVARKQPPAPIPSDGYRYTKSRNSWLVYYDICSFPSPTPLTCPAPPPDDWAFSVAISNTREKWVASDGSGRLLVESGEPRFLGPRDKATWKAAGSPELDSPGTSDQSFGPNDISYTDFSEYSTDPDELYDQIRGKAEGHGHSTDAEMLVLVGDLLRETVAPPDLRAALFEVAARIPGVELVGEATDPVGRRGTAVARTSDDAGERHELIFDPETSELLAEREVLLERVDWIDVEPGTVIVYQVYMNSGVVETTSDRP